MRFSSARSIPILFLLPILVYQNSLSNGFTYDDTSVIVENYYIKHPIWLSALFDERYFDLFGEESYRPMVSLTYFLDYYLWGFSAKGFHFTNLLLHAVNSCLFFVFFRRLFCVGNLLSDRKWVFFAAVLFAVHPVMTESVNAVGFREELLMALFTFTGLTLFLHAYQTSSYSGSWFYLLLSLSAFAAGLLSKEGMLIYPLLMYLVWLRAKEWEPERPRQQELVFAVGLLLVLVFYLFIRFDLFSGKKVVEIFSDDFWVRVTTGVSIIGYYLKLFFFPFPLAPDYTFPESTRTGGELIRAGTTFLILVGISWAVWGRRVLRFGWLWFLFALIPTLNVYPIANPLAERYLYLPSVGIYVVFAALLGRYPEPGPHYASRQKYFAGLKIFILICFAVLTHDRNFDWKNTNTLWQKAYKVTPESHKVLNNLGIIYNGKGNYAAAIQVLKKSLAINPDNVQAYSNLGLAYHKAGHDPLAVEILNRGLQRDPANVYILINLGKIKIATNHVDEGLQLMERAIEAQPFYAEPFLIKGNLYTERGDYDKAFEAYQVAVRNRPDYPEPLINIGVLYGRLGQFEKAVKVLHQALLIDPADSIANVNLASAYYFLKDYGNASMYAKIAVESGATLPDVLLPLVAH